MRVCMRVHVRVHAHVCKSKKRAPSALSARALAEGLTGLVAASWLATLQELGLERADLIAFAAKAAEGRQRLTLRTKSSESCKLNRKATREVPSDTKVEHKSTLFGSSETRVVTTVTEYFWAIGHDHELLLFSGASETAADGTCIKLASRSASCEVVTKSERPPRPEQRKAPVDCDVTWLFQQLHALGDAQAQCVAPRPTSFLFCFCVLFFSSSLARPHT